MKYRMTVLALLLAACLAGCSIMPFEDPEEQRAQEADTVGRSASAEIDPASMLDGDLSVAETLTNDLGQTVAVYNAALPRFAVDEAKKGQSFGRINDYYQEQLSGYREDCESFFTMVKEHYGAGWSAVSVPETAYRTDLTYSFTSAPEDYLCVLHTYATQNGGKSELYRGAEVFLLDSGWRLTLAELFGSHYEEAQPLLLEGIRAWCLAKGMSEDKAAALKLSAFEQSYGLDSASLLFFLPPFGLSASDEQGYTIRLPLSDFASLLPEGIGVESETPASGSAPEGAA